MDASDTVPKPIRPPPRYAVRFPISSTPCRYCPSRIVWQRTETGAKMPLSWNSREPWLREGREIGMTMIPHFIDCPGWPKRTPKCRR